MNNVPKQSSEWFNTLDFQWFTVVRKILEEGFEVSPRGRLTKELPQHTVAVNMNYPVLTFPSRRLSYKFMAAEAFWILSGDDTVEGITPWNKHIAQFSDDGHRFYGAYGPRIIEQLGYVVEKLSTDRDTRQAVLTTWRANPEKSKDIPCTVAFDFKIRGDKLNLHVFMRSSDVWLGLPYDVFNFSMLAFAVCCILNTKHIVNHIRNEAPNNERLVTPGALYLTAASSHLYEQDFEPAQKCLWELGRLSPTKPVPGNLCFSPMERQGLPHVLQFLKSLRESSKGDDIRWWEKSEWK
jgi:thymidylate synthase